jgi:hypothetical protein
LERGAIDAEGAGQLEGSADKRLAPVVFPVPQGLKRNICSLCDLLLRQASFITQSPKSLAKSLGLAHNPLLSC